MYRDPGTNKYVLIGLFHSENIQIKRSSNNFQEQSQGLVMTAEMTT